MAEQVLIEFVSDTSKLQPGVDQLEKMGTIQKDQADNYKATNVEIQKQVKALDALNATTAKIGKSDIPLKKTIIDLNNQIKGLSGSFMKDFKEGAKDALDEAGVSAQEFQDSLNKVTGETSSLKVQLREMIATLAEMKAEGKDNTDQFLELAEKAGRLKDAIGDANREVSNFGSDTSNLDGLLSLAGGVAGGFAVARGAEALFGKESKDLQQTLLSVNAAMAILQGLQQIQIVFQKESAASTLIQTGAQQLYNFVVGESIGLLKIFRIALAATGIGLIVFAIIELVSAFKKENEELRKANELIESQTHLLEAYNQGIDDSITKQGAAAEAAGALQSTIIKLQREGIALQKQAALQSNEDLARQRDSLGATSEAWFLLNGQIDKNNELIKKLNNDDIVKGAQLQKQLAVEAKQALVDLAQARADQTKRNSSADFASQKALEKAKADLEIENAGQNTEKIIQIRSALNKKLRDIDRASREQEQKEILADLETQLLNVQDASKAINDRTTQQEIDLQKKIILTKAKFDSQAEGLNQRQILEIKRKGLSDALKLQRDFNKETKKEAAEDQISRNNTELANLNISEKDKLDLIENNLILQADIELEANKGNSAKIKEINAKLDSDIKAARLASIKSTLEFELTSAQIAHADTVRGLNKALDDQDKLRSASSTFEEKRIEKLRGIRRLSLQDQLNIVDNLATIDSQAIQKRIDALNEEKRKKLISDKDYNQQYAGLIDDQTKINEEAEKKKTDITVAETEKRKQIAIEETQAIIDAATQVVGVLDNLFQLRTAKETAALDEQKQKLKDLQDAGAITEKEAAVRQKRIDAEERRNKQLSAQREKTIAVFNAALAVPQAFLKGLIAGGPILGAIYAGFAAVNLAIVAARPVPKFGKGKKNRYQGLAEVGETGTELIESNGRMYVADKKQTVWLGADDKVFNPQETTAMLAHGSMNTERVMINGHKQPVFSIDYDKMGQAVAKHSQTNVYVDGVQEQAVRKREFTSWLTKRRSW